jgi:hypothetical protein
LPAGSYEDSCEDCTRERKHPDVFEMRWRSWGLGELGYEHV